MPGRKRADGGEVEMQGVPVSHGVAIGPAFVLRTADEPDAELSEIEGGQVPAEIARFEGAVIETRRQLREIQKSVGQAVGEGGARVFDVHLMVLDDGLFVDGVIRKIRDQRRGADGAVAEAAKAYASALSAVEDEYLRERVADVRDVARRVLRNLSGKTDAPLSTLDHKVILVADDLGPSETAMLRKENVLAFATDFGSGLSHTAIMARALEIPAVVGLHDITRKLASGEELLVDGDKGLVLLHPGAARLVQYGKVVGARQKLRRDMTSRLRNKLAATTDGRRIVVSANLELEDEVVDVRKHGAEGVGLMRSEFIFITRRELPSEDEQFKSYDRVAGELAPDPVIIRTLDSGGDKLLPSLRLPPEVNPFMGFRAVRFCLAHPELFKGQMRAILRATRRGNVKIMYPMITDVHEVIRSNELLEEAKGELRRAGVPFDERVEVGAMIETPSAALTADLIAPHVRFFSLGTNDLVQYSMAVDRVNERVSYLYAPTHPSILKLIRHTVEAGHAAGIWVGVCGEMGGDPLMSPLLVGLGVDELSMAPSSVPLVKRCVMAVSQAECVALAQRSLGMSVPAEIAAACRDLIERRAPEILELIS